MKQDDFYKAFEDKYRGSREDIKKRQQIYLPFVKTLQEIYPKSKVIDIGCGRGEWLELLRDLGIDAIGVDNDKAMLKVAHKYSLNVLQDDAISYIKSLPDDSCMVISAFHVVEHISFEDIQVLVTEALRVLKPAGLLILETPNPENVRVSSEYFYIDPTHIKPLPSSLMSFVLEYYGFARVKQLRLQEEKSLINQKEATIREVFEGVSPDYAVIGQKEADKSILKKFDKFFDKDYGVSLDMVYDKFSNTLYQLNSSIELIEKNTIILERKIDDISIEVADTKQQTLSLEADIKQHIDDNINHFNYIEEKFTDSFNRIAALESRVVEAEMRYTELLNSNSWKFTYPLRKARQAFRWFYTGVYHWVTFSPTSRPRRVAKKLLVKVKNYLQKHPNLKVKIKQILYRFPILRTKALDIINTSNEPISQNKYQEFCDNKKVDAVLNEIDIYKTMEVELEKKRKL